jgi:tetratricopeptide (TPR) repeat protein
MGLLPERTQAAELWIIAYPSSALAHLALGACLSVQQPDRAMDSLYANGQVVAGGQVLWTALDNFSKSDDLGRGWMEVGQALGQMGEWRLAVAAFEYSVDAEPRLAETWALLGEARDQAGLDGGQALQTAYSLNNQSAVTLGLLGLHERRTRNYGGAMMYFERAARLEPAKAIWQLELAATYEALGDLPRTQSFLVEAARLEPRNPQVWRTIAAFTLAHAVEISETGLPAARQAAALAPEDPLSLDMMGQILFALGDAPTARRYFSQAVEIAPTNAALWYHLGQAAAATNDNTTAYNAFMNVVQMAGSGDLVDMANKYLLRLEGE